MSSSSSTVVVVAADWLSCTDEAKRHTERMHHSCLMQIWYYQTRIRLTSLSGTLTSSLSSLPELAACPETCQTTIEVSNLISIFNICMKCIALMLCQMTIYTLPKESPQRLELYHFFFLRFPNLLAKIHFTPNIF